MFSTKDAWACKVRAVARKRDPENDRVREHVGVKMRELLPELGLSQAEFARRLETDPSQVGRWYWGRVLPEYSRQLQIARELGISVSELRGEDNRDHEDDAL